jgi:hypothetical protein
MLTRRTLLKQGVCATLSAATATLAGRVAHAESASSAGFDFYISPIGSDSNPGTLAQPWAITAINTHRDRYAGRRVGVLDGTYNVHSLCQSTADNGVLVALAVNGGSTAGAPTVIGAVNARQAILTAADPATGSYATSQVGIIGQGYRQVANNGNVILDGLYVTRSAGAGIYFFPALSSQPEGGATGIVVRNCEIYDIGGIENNNVGGIKLRCCTGALLSNNKIHSVQPDPPGQDDAGIFSFASHSNIYEYNTIYDCNSGIYDKNPHTGNHTYRYNYIELTGPHRYTALTDCSGGDAGDVVTVHNNIFVAPGIWNGSEPRVPSQQSLVFYNNTCYCQGKEGSFFYPAGGSEVSPPATVTFYNNIVYYPATTGYAGAVRFCSGTVVLSNYNLFRVDGNERGIFGLSPLSAPRSAPTLYSLSEWRKATGMDGNSIASDVAATSLFGAQVGLNATSYALQNSVVARNLGRVGGVASGAATDAGAWGGGATRIGCDFGPMPRSPTLSPG